MYYNELSPQGEKLLQEIIDLLSNHVDNAAHWKARFGNLSREENDLLRSVFGELNDNEYINVQWADNIPCNLSVTVDGMNYMENKKRAEKEERKLSRREWRIAIVSAIAGALIGLVPWIMTLVGGGQ